MRSNAPQLQRVPDEEGNVALPTSEGTAVLFTAAGFRNHQPSLFSLRKECIASRDANLFKETLKKDEENIYSMHLTIQNLLFTLTRTLGKYIKMGIYSCIKSNSVSVSSIKSVTLHTRVHLLLPVVQKLWDNHCILVFQRNDRLHENDIILFITLVLLAVDSLSNSCLELKQMELAQIWCC